MPTHNKDKLKILIHSMKPGTVMLASWLKELGISGDLQKYYRKSGWIESVGRGAFKKTGDHINWQGAVYALQEQSKLKVHVGALTALSLYGLSHYIRLSEEKIYLFMPGKGRLPEWFIRYDWGNPVHLYQTTFLPGTEGINSYSETNFSLKISSPERAILECLYLAPDTIDLVECFHLMEGLVNLRPGLLQKLMQNCRSVKVKRLFLYLAEKVNHQWFRFIDLSVIDLGKGNRRLAKESVYISKYQISIPRELAEL